MKNTIILPKCVVCEMQEYSNEVVKNRVKLCKKFIAAVKKCKLPVLTELW